jgi:methyltransferase (TIGR00027 family)
MNAGRPSRTAQLVAIGRAMAHVGLTHIPDFHDPTARVFLDAKGKRSLADIERAMGAGKRSVRIEMARTLADTMALRTAAIDAAVRDAVAGGATQLVILGAGYDGRAWRMPALGDVTVYEVDHPTTQADKRTHLSELPATTATVRFVPVDFERDSLDDALDRAGHDRASPTCWIWEGVVMYLTREAMRATLAAVAARSAPGSSLIVNYHTSLGRIWARLMLRLAGEPQISAWSQEQMAAELSSAGFVVREDSGMADWNARFAESRAKIDRALYMRIVIARKH